jgi:signal transduction histidine kinase
VLKRLYLVLVLTIILLIIVILANSLIGLGVFLRNPKSATNISFLGLTSVFTIWTIINHLSIDAVDNQLLLARLVLFVAAALNLSVFIAFDTLPETKFPRKFLVYLSLMAVTVAVMALALSPLVFSSLDGQGAQASPVPGLGIIVFALHTILFIGASLFSLIKKYRLSKNQTRRQLKTIIFGTLLSFMMIIGTNFITVTLFGSINFLQFAPLYVLVFVSFFAYAIVKQRFLDIRSIIARSVTYSLLVVTVGAVYGLAIFAVSNLLLGSIDNSAIYQQGIYIIIAVFIAFTFQSLKKIFDKITNKIFFHDNYDIDSAMAELGRIVSEQISLEVVIHAVNLLITNNVKIRDIRTVVLDDVGSIYRIDSFGKTNGLAPNINNLKQFDKYKLSVLDDLDKESNRIIAFKRLDVAVVATLRTVDGVVGYVLLGPKENGSTYRSQDIKFLEIAAKQLAIAVQNARYFSQISEFNATLQDKVDKATAKLEKTNEKLKELDTAKDEFISMASHQLRTPLTTVKGYLSMLLEEDAGKLSAQQREFIEQAFGSSQRMVYLIADLLNVSRLSTGKFVIESKNSDLSEIVEQEIEQLQRSAKTKNIKLSYKKPKDFPRVEIDETKIRQVIMNFTDNALYYTPSKGRVEVSLEESGKSIEFKVKDSGIGVPQAMQHKLFTKFYRAENAQAVRPDGTGLGLFMAKKVILAQGGSIIFNSKEGKGSTFGFTFPKQKILAKEQAKLKETDKLISKRIPSLIEKPKSSNPKKIQVTTK